MALSRGLHSLQPVFTKTTTFSTLSSRLRHDDQSRGRLLSDPWDICSRTIRLNLRLAILLARINFRRKTQ